MNFTNCPILNLTLSLSLLFYCFNPLDNNNTSEDFDESPSLVMGVLAASLRKAIEKRKVAHLFEMIDVIIILARYCKLF